MISVTSVARRLWRSPFGERVFQGRIVRSLPLGLLLKMAVATRYVLEEDLALIPLLCRPDRIAVDVGAHFGHYTHHMVRHSRFVHAFEPLPDYARALALAFPEGVIVEAVALSDRSGQCRLRTPTANPALSTIEVGNTLAKAPVEGRVEEIVVPTRRLDDYGLRDVGFIKIDVEGHELAVLVGARTTLERDRPTLLVEIEDRHRPNAIAETTAFLCNLGYEGFFHRDGRLHPIATFVPSIHQNPDNVSAYGKRGEYIVNFVFLGVADLSRLGPGVERGEPAARQT